MQTEILPQPYGCIYKITNKINGKCYIGQTTDIYRRFRKYRQLKCERQPKIYNALVKYGPDNFLFEIIDKAPDKSFLDSLENSYVISFNCIDNGYNCRPGGINCNGKITEETKRKISKALSGRRLSDETKQKMSKMRLGMKRSPQAIQNISKCKMGINNPNYGKHLSEETKRKMSASLCGKEHTAETKKALSEMRKGDNNPMRKRKLLTKPLLGHQEPLS